MAIFIIDWGFGVVWSHTGTLKSAKESVENKMMIDSKVRPYKVIIRDSKGIALTCSRYHRKQLLRHERRLSTSQILVNKLIDKGVHGFYEKWSDEQNY